MGKLTIGAVNICKKKMPELKFLRFIQCENMNLKHGNKRNTCNKINHKIKHSEVPIPKIGLK